MLFWYTDCKLLSDKFYTCHQCVDLVLINIFLVLLRNLEVDQLNVAADGNAYVKEHFIMQR